MISDLRFNNETVNSDFLKTGLGSCFSRFCFEVLRNEFDGLHIFPVLGVDGCIDMCFDNNGERHVFECKYIGNDDISKIRGRWKEVEGNLSKNIIYPNGPKSTQYSPWYNKTPLITQYTFCISALLANSGQLDKLTLEITSFFQNMSTRFSHLQYFKNIKVQVRDWQDFKENIADSPQTLFKWFPIFCPSGLKSIDDEIEFQGFRKYLSNKGLPYYSLAEHIRIIGKPDNYLPDENEIVSYLEEPESTGVAITGIGGVGKTRLALEIARICSENGWVVFRVEPDIFDSEQLEKLLKTCMNNRLLLILDYIETFPDFNRLLGRILEANKQHEFPIRYIACCRRPFYHSQIMNLIGEHRVVDLSPTDANLMKWFADYQQAVVKHIFNHINIFPIRKKTNINTRLPIAAVLFTYKFLKISVTDQLDDTDNSFDSWLQNSINRTIPNWKNTSLTAKTMAILPFPDSKLYLLNEYKLREIFDTLIEDGWVEQTIKKDNTNKELKYWSIIHDVIADQVITSFIEAHPKTVSGFLNDVITIARETSSLESAILSFQRISDAQMLAGVDWYSIFVEHIEKDSAKWKNAGLALIRCSLISKDKLISLLESFPSIWIDSLNQQEFLSAIGWLSKYTAQEPLSTSRSNHIAVLKPWLAKGVDIAIKTGNSSYILHYALRLLPSDFKMKALEWINHYPESTDSSYLFTEFLDIGFSYEEISEYIAKWLNANWSHPSFPFLLGRSLKVSKENNTALLSIAINWINHQTSIRFAGNAIGKFIYSYESTLGVDICIDGWLLVNCYMIDSRRVIEELLCITEGQPLGVKYAKIWLNKFAHNIEAERLYSVIIKNSIEPIIFITDMWKWLSIYANNEKSRFLIQNYLDKTGDLSQMGFYAQSWLAIYHSHYSADHVMSAWIRAGGIIDTISKYIETWLSVYKSQSHARFLLESCLRKCPSFDLVKTTSLEWLKIHGTMIEARYLLSALLDIDIKYELIFEPVKQWINHNNDLPEAQYVFSAWLRHKYPIAPLRGELLKWLDKYAELDGSDFVFSSWLDSLKDIETITPFLLRWLNTHSKSIEATYVFQAWLDSGGSAQVIEKYVLEWLSVFGSNEDAQFVLRPWLEYSHNNELIKQSVFEWLTLYSIKPQASFILSKWFESDGEIAVVQKFFESWLEMNASSIDALFLLGTYIKRGGILQPIEKSVKNSLDSNGLQIDAQKVIASWIKYGGPKDFISPYFFNWLDANRKHPDALYPLCEWLRAGGKLENIQLFIIEWLDNNSSNKFAGYLFTDWISAKGSFAIIKPAIAKWFSYSNNAEIFETHRIIYYWLKNGGERAVIEPLIIIWLNHFADSSKARFVLDEWLSSDASLEIAEPFVISYLSKNAEEKSAEYVLSEWLHKGGDYDKVCKFISIWINRNYKNEALMDLSNYLLRKRIKDFNLIKTIFKGIAVFKDHRNALYRVWQACKSGYSYEHETTVEILSVAEAVLLQLFQNNKPLSIQDCEQVTTICSYFIDSNKLSFEQQYKERVDNLYIVWLRHPQSYGLSLPEMPEVQRPLYFKRFVDLLCENKIDVVRDCIAIEKFFVWINKWSDQAKLPIRGKVNHLRKKFKHKIEKQIARIILSKEEENVQIKVSTQEP